MHYFTIGKTGWLFLVAIDTSSGRGDAKAYIIPRKKATASKTIAGTYDFDPKNIIAKLEGNFPEIRYQAEGLIKTKMPYKDMAKIMHWDDERDNENGIIVGLRWGWCIFDEGCHTFGEDTLTLLKDRMSMVKPCNCEECQAAMRRGWDKV